MTKIFLIFRDIDFECCELNIDEREGGEENLKSEVIITREGDG